LAQRSKLAGKILPAASFGHRKRGCEATSNPFVTDLLCTSSEPLKGSPFFCCEGGLTLRRSRGQNLRLPLAADERSKFWRSGQNLQTTKRFLHYLPLSLLYACPQVYYNIYRNQSHPLTGALLWISDKNR